MKAHGMIDLGLMLALCGGLLQVRLGGPSQDGFQIAQKHRRVEVLPNGFDRQAAEVF